MERMSESAALPARSRPTWWKWWVCTLLLLATTINYMDRQTLASTSTRITEEFRLSEEQYGTLELYFGLAFAVGASLFGFVADRTSVRWLYPAVLVLWSIMGFSTGMAQTYAGLLICRALLGFFEAGHWPCALKTTQRLLAPKDRTLGNSILQSGTSIGAFATPLLMNVMLTNEPGSWRFVFQAIGAVGMIWIVFWFLSVRDEDLNQPPPEDTVAGPSTLQVSATPDEASYWSVVFSRRFLVLLVVVVAINACWHVFRVWLPKFLIQGRGYEEKTALYFTSLYYVATDVGCLSAGAASIWLHRRGLSVRVSRTLVFTICAGMTALSALVSYLPAGWPLILLLLMIGFGSLGQFPCYYSFSQQLSVRHQGKISGLLGTFAWAVSAPIHKFFGRLIDQTGKFDTGLTIAGWAPLFAALVLWLFWKDTVAESKPSK